MKKTLPILLLAAILTGCGGERAAETPAAVTSEKEAPAEASSASASSSSEKEAPAEATASEESPAEEESLEAGYARNTVSCKDALDELGVRDLTYVAPEGWDCRSDKFAFTLIPDEQNEFSVWFKEGDIEEARDDMSYWGDLLLETNEDQINNRYIIKFTTYFEDRGQYAYGYWVVYKNDEDQYLIGIEGSLVDQETMPYEEEIHRVAETIEVLKG